MAEKKATVPFSGTKEQEEALMKVIHELKDEKGALMPILQKAQDIYGYLPIEVQKMISDETGIPMEKIYGGETKTKTIEFRKDGVGDRFEVVRNHVYIFNIKVTETPAGGGLKTDVETYVADWDEILLSPGYE